MWSTQSGNFVRTVPAPAEHVVSPSPAVTSVELGALEDWCLLCYRDASYAAVHLPTQAVDLRLAHQASVASLTMAPVFPSPAIQVILTRLEARESVFQKRLFDKNNV